MRRGATIHQRGIGLAYLRSLSTGEMDDERQLQVTNSVFFAMFVRNRTFYKIQKGKKDRVKPM